MIRNPKGDPPPISEQRRAREIFLQGEGLRIDAYAGTGKTSTLKLLADASPQKGLYLAFNRSIAEEAKQKFPIQVTCATGHSIAFRHVLRNFGYPEWKLTGSLTPNIVAASFTMPDFVSFRSGLNLPKRTYCSILLDAIRQFLQSDDEEPQPKHIPRVGCFQTMPEADFEDFTQQSVSHVRSIWKAMRHRQEGFPLGHDGYLKLWALSKPKAQVDYIMVDEAQDLNPVLVGVLRSIDCPVIYVGDPYQQIYEWRGAINVMAQLPSRHSVLLSQSFRFGKAIADAATVILRQLGAKEPLRGLADMESHLARVIPDAILARSNAGVIASVLQCLSKGITCHVLGGTRELERVLYDVERVKQGAIAQSPELLGFHTWKDVMTFSAQPEGEYLRSLVTLVQQYGEQTMLRAITRCEPEERTARVICSTAHKAKGREWEYVRVESDFDAAISRASRLSRADGGARERRTSLEAENRILYVAMTRAQRGVHIPSTVMSRLGLKPTSAEILGRQTKGTAAQSTFNNTDMHITTAISPYHAPQKNDSREMAALRKIFR